MAAKLKSLSALLRTMKVNILFFLIKNVADSRAVELGVVIGKRGRNIRQEDADSYIGGYGKDIYHYRCLQLCFTLKKRWRSM
jgi:hypothetical protein